MGLSSAGWGPGTQPRWQQAVSTGGHVEPSRDRVSARPRLVPVQRARRPGPPMPHSAPGHPSSILLSGVRMDSPTLVTRPPGSGGRTCTPLGPSAPWAPVYRAIEPGWRRDVPGCGEGGVEIQEGTGDRVQVTSVPHLLQRAPTWLCLAPVTDVITTPPRGNRPHQEMETRRHREWWWLLAPPRNLPFPQ